LLLTGKIHTKKEDLPESHLIPKETMRLVKRIIIATVSIIVILAFGLFIFYKFYKPPLSENYGKVDAQLFVGSSENQPLIVAFGGSQGGNTWTEDYWAEMRNRFLERGYALLSIGYFNSENTPQTPDRISLSNGKKITYNIWP
jgi:uncharacterized protein